MNQPIRFTTEVRGLSGYQTPAEVRTKDEIMGVVLAQPHRKPAIKLNGEIAASSDDARLGTALGRLCAHYKPMPLGEHLERAGEDYGSLHRRALAYMGLGHHSPSDNVEPGEFLTDDELRHRKDAERARLEDAEGCLVRVIPTLKSRMHSLCVLDIDPPQDHIQSIVRGLQALSVFFRTQPRNFRDC